VGFFVFLHIIYLSAILPFFRYWQDVTVFDTLGFFFEAVLNTRLLKDLLFLMGQKEICK